MLTIHFDCFPALSCPYRILCDDPPLTLSDLQLQALSVLPVPSDQLYFVYNGKIVDRSTLVTHGTVRVSPRLLGGKGGFGSMLRAIGAQIEKTTNREACRDLSGRRLRDINEEKRLKNWISKKAEREREALERKKRKLEKLRAEPKVVFSDKHYEEERSKLTEGVNDAVEKGMQAATSSGTSILPKKAPSKKGFMFEEEEFSCDSSLDSTDVSGDEDQASKLEAGSQHDDSSPSKLPNVDNTESDDSSDVSGDEGQANKRKADSQLEEHSVSKKPVLDNTDSDSESSDGSLEDSNTEERHAKSASSGEFMDGKITGRLQESDSSSSNC